MFDWSTVVEGEDCREVLIMFDWSTVMKLEIVERTL